MITVKDSYFSKEFFDLVEEESKDSEEHEGRVNIADPRPDEDMRRSTVKFFESPKVRNELFELINIINAEDYRFDIYNHAHMQYTIYDESNKGHYNWHRDDGFLGGGYLRRKISVSIQLSSSWDYEGGDFEIEDYELPDWTRRKGTALVFPSFMNHRVTPVTKGTRKSLVAWFYGPNWR